MTWSVSVSSPRAWVKRDLEREFARVVNSGQDMTLRDLAAITAEVDCVLLTSHGGQVSVSASGYRSDGDSSSSASLNISVSAY